MATFLVERFWPSLTAGAAETATATLLASGVNVVETIIAAKDEVCLWYVEADSEAHVAATFRQAVVPFDRVSAATRLPR